MPAWISTGFTDYQRRMPNHLPLELIEIPLPKRQKLTNIEKLKAQEGAEILKKISANEKVIALEVKGEAWSTITLSEKMATWLSQGQTINLLVGGPDGLDLACLDRADQLWSLSPLTLPHPLVRVLIAEQLYRAYTLLSNHPYHRE